MCFGLNEILAMLNYLVGRMKKNPRLGIRKKLKKKLKESIFFTMIYNPGVHIFVFLDQFTERR